jgi:probable addiction module antidote protein
MPEETTRFDIQDHLRTPEDQVAFVEAVLEDGDADLIATALGDIARARGVTEFAREAGLSRETIYKALRKGGNPTLDTVTRCVRALGLRLALQPAD